MAEIVESPDWRPGPSDTKYPWDEWLDGRAWKLERGKDFIVVSASFVRAATSAARTRGKRIRTHVSFDQSVTIQAVTPRTPRG